MNWFRRQLDELKMLLFMMVGVSPPKDLQERMGLRESEKDKTDKNQKRP